MCQLVRTKSCGQAIAESRCSLGRSGGYTGQGRPGPGAGRYNQSALQQTFVNYNSIATQLKKSHFFAAGTTLINQINTWPHL